MKMNAKSIALSAVIAASFMAAGAMASDKTEPRNEVYKDKFSNQYNSWHATAESEEIVDMLEQVPSLVVLWAGYGFAKDYNAPRSYMYAVTDVTNSLRTGAPKNAEDSYQCQWHVGAVKALTYLVSLKSKVKTVTLQANGLKAVQKSLMF
ncbi:ammonia-forming cytochrome c nitrite reductase subunit c552 [Paucibacter sp. O1-1]|nr:ammonia-forming cytochrome c nitrite reductase subunit c552 [Paucibacter sp. O1-1]MDA3831062.1 ammonia-forming cytochrome c nitrite reductase subunit c552 [Paucibacter sp. O1-1]